MPSQSSNPKKPRIRNLKKIQAEQNGYILSEEDLSTLQLWKATLTPLTWKKYASCILTVCDYYVRPIHDMTPDLWINYINKILPNQLNTCKISKFSYNSYRYAILNFLDFYGMQNPDFKNIREQVAKLREENYKTFLQSRTDLHWTVKNDPHCNDGGNCLTARKPDRFTFLAFWTFANIINCQFMRLLLSCGYTMSTKCYQCRS